MFKSPCAGSCALNFPLSRKAAPVSRSRGWLGHVLGTGCLLSPGGTETLWYSCPGPPCWSWAQGLPGTFTALSSHLQLCGAVGLRLVFSRMFVSGSKPRKRLQFSLSNNSWLYLWQEIFNCRQNCMFRYIHCLMSESVRGPCIAWDPSFLPTFCMLPPFPEHGTLWLFCLFSSIHFLKEPINKDFSGNTSAYRGDSLTRILRSIQVLGSMAGFSFCMNQMPYWCKQTQSHLLQ